MNAEIKDPSGGSPGLSKFLLSNSAVGQNLALRAAPADRASTQLVSAFPAHSTSFFCRDDCVVGGAIYVHSISISLQSVNLSMKRFGQH